MSSHGMLVQYIILRQPHHSIICSMQLHSARTGSAKLPAFHPAKKRGVAICFPHEAHHFRGFILGVRVKISSVGESKT